MIRARRRFTTAACSSLALLCLGAQCENPEPGLTPPDDARLVATGSFGEQTYETGFENPIVRGHTPLNLADFTVSRRDAGSLLFGDRVGYAGPVLVNVRIPEHDVLEPAFLDITRGGVDLSWNYGFFGPGLSLIPGDAAVQVRVETVAEGFPGEFDEFIARVDRIRYQLAPSVLVVPVRALVFADDDGSLPYLGGDADTAQGVMSQLFDAAGSTGFERAAAAGFSATAAQFEVFESASPDQLWHQCGIQFHLDAVEVAPQADDLEEELASSTDPCLTFTTAPLGPYLVDLRAEDALPLFVGGSLRNDLLSELLGATCHSGSSSAFVAVNGHYALSAGIVAHELGHVFLGTAHTSDPDALMSPPNPRTASIAGTELSADQCLLARCRAARLLLSFGRLEQSRVDEECAPFDPVCGDGELESPEQCDDGNLKPGDGCRADCTRELCGDGQVDAGEECDWRIPEQQPNCNAKCELCDACNVCGNGVVDPGEECDDGNKDPLDGCTNDCHFTLG